MLHTIQKIRELLFGDSLFLRVSIFITGALITAIPLAAVLFGALSKNYDSALYILLVLFAILGLFLLYASLFGNDRFLDNASNWAISDEILFIIGLFTFAIPITLLIRWLKSRPNRNDA